MHTDYEYCIEEDGSVMITRYIGSAVNIIIPSKIDGRAVTVIGGDAFRARSNNDPLSLQYPQQQKISDTFTIMDISV